MGWFQDGHDFWAKAGAEPPHFAAWKLAISRFRS
jgi:hypothetical protein